METVNEFLCTLAREGVKLSVEAGRLNCYAPKGSLTPVIRDGITKYRTEIISLLEGRKRRPATDGDGWVGESVKEFPLSAGQKGLFLLQKLHPTMSAYNVPVCFRINQSLDAALLAKAWDYVLDQYPILTARVVERNGALYQRLDAACRTTLQQHSIEPVNDEQLLALLKLRSKQPFDPDQGPLTRIDLFSWGGPESILLLTVHHLVIDGTSAMIVLRSFLEFYQQLCAKRPVRLSHDLPGYHEFVAWEEAMLASPEGEAHASYWRKQLSGELPIIELVPDRPDSMSATFEGKTLAEQLPQQLSQWVREYSRAHSLRASVIFLALFQLVLHKYTDQEDIIIGMPVMGRAGQRFLSEVGYFINMVPLRTHCEPRLKLSEFFRRVQATMLDALFHSSYPFPLMLETLRIKEVRKNPVFQVLYAYQNFINPDTFAPLLQRQALHIVNIPELTQEGEFDLGLEIFEEGPLFSMQLKYNPALYAEQTIRRLFESYCALLKGASEDSDRPLHEYSIISGPERERVVVDFNDNATDYPKDECIHHLFAGQVAADPDKTAVRYGEQKLTYRELNDKSHDLALYLQSLGVKPGMVVGLCIDRSLEMMVGLLGILQAGGAYAPLDPGYPIDRLDHMLRDSHTSIVLTHAKLEDKLAATLPRDVRLVALDRQWPEIADCVTDLKQKHVPLQKTVKPNDLAYVIYTSGSTGQPKGVMVEHQSVNRLVRNTNYIQISKDDVFLQLSSLSFDAATLELWGPLLNGATLVIPPPGLDAIAEIGHFVNKYKISVLWLTSGLFQLVVDENVEALANVRVLLTGGDVVPVEHARRFLERCTKSILINGYGPTENTTFTACYVVSGRLENLPKTLPIGRPIANTQVYILDAHQKVQPVGVPGDLYIAGDGLARGYLNHPELTREKFVANPFHPGTRMYKSGDLARWLPDGNIEFLGRRDTQVKIRGFRIEMEEIEARLNQHPDVQGSAVIAQGPQGNKQLIAFYRARRTTADHIVPLPYDALRAHLSERLPPYMVPAAFVSLAAIPLNASGKVDRRALERMDLKIASSKKYAAPRNATETQLVAIFAEVLKLAPESIGLNDNFFELGGHSLLATQLISKIRCQLDVDLPLKAVFEQTSVAQLAELIATARKNEVPPIRPVDRAQFQRLPLSFAQERLWFINQLKPNSAGYNVSGAVTVRGELDVENLEQAFNAIVARHESLRTVFPSHEGQAHEVILDRVDFKLQRIDLRAYDEDARDKEAKRICRAEAERPFDLVTGSLFRGMVIKLAEHEHILMLNMHHIISDGWSIGVLIKELRTIMDGFRYGRPPELPPLPIQYVDYAIWQRQWLEGGGILERQLAYWQEKLAGVPESLDLVTDYPRPSVQTFAGANHAFALDARLTGQLKRLADHQGATLYMVLLAVLKVLLYRYTGQNDLCVGSPIANRQYGETEGLIGMFVNTLALRSQVDEDDTFVALLTKVKATCLEAYEHQDAPFEKVVDLLRPQRDLATSPLFQVVLVLQNVDTEVLDASIQRYPLESDISKFDLTFEFTESTAELGGRIEYSTALYNSESVERMAEHFTALCQAITATPTAKIRGLQYIDDAEKHRLLAEFNDTRADYPNQTCVHELFAERAAMHPDKTAVVCGERELSYGELYEASGELALYLQSKGVGPDRIVALVMDRSADMMVGIMGTALAGGAYLPMDPDYPDERLAYVLQDSQATVVLTDGKFRDRLASLFARNTELIAFDSEWPRIRQWAAAAKAEGVELRREVKSHHLAYVIYTSGSTGQPKGVMVEHRNLANLVQWHRTAFGLCEGDRSSCLAGVGFDAAVWEMWPSLSVGATLAMATAEIGRDPEALLQWWETVPVEVSFLPTPLAEFAFSRGISNAQLRILLTGGDRLHQLPSRSERFRLINNYGPTECTVVATSGELPNPSPVLHIGRPIANTQVYILDAHRQPVPIGVAGEIYVGGAGVARGYLNRPELTAERFLGDPFSSHSGARMYRSGDLARWRYDGTIQYIGRVDTQVKIRGLRIELGEIEAQLSQHPRIQDCAVIAQGQDSDKQLIAFYRARETQVDHLVEVSSEEFRAYLLRTLPNYMVPAAFVSVAAIPLNASGKVDRRALERMDVTLGSAHAYVAPRNVTQERLVAIFAEVLKRAPESIGLHDNFFEVGGHSLSAVQLIFRINHRFKRSLPLLAIFTHPHVAALAELLSGEESTFHDLVVPIQSGGDALPIFGIPGTGGIVPSLQPLSRALGKSQPFYALQAVGLDGTAAPLSSVEETALANIAAVKKVQPRGPYRFIGHSYGGVVAYEMARLLLEQGEEVASLTLLDSIAPSVLQERYEAGEVHAAKAKLNIADVEIDPERLLRSENGEDARYLDSLRSDSGVEIDRNQFAAFQEVCRANLSCYRTYKPSMLPREIDVALYRATQRDSQAAAMPDDYGWNRLLHRPIRVYDVDADHYSILRTVQLHEVGSPRLEFVS